MPREYFPCRRNGILFASQDEWDAYWQEQEVCGPFRAFLNNCYADGLVPQPSSKQVPSPTPTPGKLLSVVEAAAIAGLSTKRIRKLVGAGKLRATRFGTGKTAPIYIHRMALEEYIAGLPSVESMVRKRRRRAG